MYLILAILVGVTIYTIRKNRKKIKEANENTRNSKLTDIASQGTGSPVSLSDYYSAEILSSWDNDYVAIDTETTGFSPTQDKLIEFAALKVKDGKVVDSYSTLINPGLNLPLKITEITGITDDMLNDAPKINSVIHTISNFIGDSPVIGHNVIFDIKFLAAARNSCGLPVFNVTYIDTLPLSRKEFPELPDHKLVTLISELQLADKQDHRALSDAMLTHQLYQIMRSHNVPELVNLPADIKPFLGISSAHIVKENEKKVCYSIKPQYRSSVINMVLALNPLIQQATSFVPTFEPNVIEANSIIFEPFTEKYSWNKNYAYEVEEQQPASYIEEQVFTSLGNIKKHPFILNFFTRKHRFYDRNDISQADEVFGKLFIGKDGNVSRIEITHWKNASLHRIYCTKDKDNSLTISKIESTDNNGMRFVKYKRP